MQNIANNSDALDAQQAAIAKNIRECQCGNYSDATTGERIECHAETTRTFAPGHDAKLKGFLIRAGIAGHEVRVLGEDTLQGTGIIANRYGFSGQVLRGIINGRAKKAPKAARKTVEAKPTAVTAKVGRWIYEGVILAAGDGTPVFRYTDKKGVSQDAMKFTRI